MYKAWQKKFEYLAEELGIAPELTRPGSFPIDWKAVLDDQKYMRQNGRVIAGHCYMSLPPGIEIGSEIVFTAHRTGGSAYSVAFRAKQELFEPDGMQVWYEEVGGVFSVRIYNGQAIIQTNERDVVGVDCKYKLSFP